MLNYDNWNTIIFLYYDKLHILALSHIYLYLTCTIWSIGWIEGAAILFAVMLVACVTATNNYNKGSCDVYLIINPYIYI